MKIVQNKLLLYSEIHLSYAKFNIVLISTLDTPIWEILLRPLNHL